MPIVECVPNFSEGRRPAVIDQITAAIKAVEGAVLLDVDPGKATNRTVVTLVVTWRLGGENWYRVPHLHGGPGRSVERFFTLTQARVAEFRL